MSDTIKMALILAGALIVCVAAYIYFSPYQTCVRDSTGGGWDDAMAHRYCLISSK